MYLAGVITYSLDTDERRRFAQVSHEYLIEQVQFSNALSVKGTSTQHELRFNHPVKELGWTVHDNSAHETMTAMERPIKITTLTLQLTQHFYNLTATIASNAEKANTSLKSKDTNTTKVPVTQNAELLSLLLKVAARADNSVPHVYSFALKPEEHQPSACNFSRIDNAVLNLEHADATGHLRVYAVNYNVLRIMVVSHTLTKLIIYFMLLRIILTV